MKMISGSPALKFIITLCNTGCMFCDEDDRHYDRHSVTPGCMFCDEDDRHYDRHSVTPGDCMWEEY